MGYSRTLPASTPTSWSQYPFGFRDRILSRHARCGSILSGLLGKPLGGGRLREYFESILENIAAFDGFDVYGHIDYVVRYGPNKNANYSYQKYADIIDEILKALIIKGKGIEINTGGFKYGLGHPNPAEDIIKRYHELGGEIITIGADAHQPEHVAFDFEKVPSILKEAGFTHYTVFKNRKPEFIPIP